MATSYTRRWLLSGLAAPLLAATAACGLNEPENPALSGPSAHAHSFTLAASPTQLPRDGQSQAVITLRAADVTGGPLSGQRYSVSVSPTTAAPSITEVTTDSSGRASFAVRAPSSTSAAPSIDVTATAIGGFADTTSQFLTISLIGDSATVVAPPTVTSISVEPTSPIADQPSIFTATATAAAGHRITQYAWNFGDGTTATTTTGQVVKTYTVPGSFTVLVTVTDDVGGTASALTSVEVVNATSNAPVARFTVNPSQPVAGQTAQFDASSSTAGNRAVIVRYTWNFGDGVTEVTSTPTIGHVFTEARTFAVTLTVTDNLGQTSTVGRQVTAVP
jgi:PKD repeat protein